MPSEIGGFSMVELHDGKVELHSEQSSEAHESGSEDEDQTRKTQDAKDAKDPKVANSKTARKNSDASSTRFVEVMYPSEDEDRAGPQSNAPTNSDRDPKDTNSEPANDVSPLVDRMSILKVDEYGIPTEQTTAQSSLVSRDHEHVSC